MRIAMVSEHASPLAAIGGEDAGGQNVHVAALSSQLVRRGHDVTVWTRRDDPVLPDRVEIDGVAVEHVDAGPPAPVAKDRLLRWMDDFADVLQRRWAEDPPDIIHAHFWMSGYATLRARPARTPVIHTYHALGVVKRRHLGSADPSPAERLDIEASLARTADRIVATCREEVRELRGIGASRRRVDVVPCGVDLERFTRDGPRENPQGRQRIVSVGRLVARKGFDDAIHALVELPDVELVIAGGPPAAELTQDPEAQRLRDVAEQVGVADRVSLRGAVSRADMPALLRSADVVVCTPWYEPFGIVPLEAMACGVPVVASAVGGMLDTVVDGVTGMHVPPRYPAALSKVLRRLLDDTALRRRMGVNGHLRAVREYGWRTVAARTLDAYIRARPPVRATGATEMVVP